MTNEELDKLDRIAAEKLGVENIYLSEGEVLRHGKRGPIWQPTRNIAHAWLCLEKMISENWNSTTYDSPGPNKGCVLHLGPNMFRSLNQETVTIAIVLACLRAKGIEV